MFLKVWNIKLGFAYFGTRSGRSWQPMILPRIKMHPSGHNNDDINDSSLAQLAGTH
jgi:hypothetical protein